MSIYIILKRVLDEFNSSTKDRVCHLRVVVDRNKNNSINVKQKFYIEIMSSILYKLMIRVTNPISKVLSHI